MGRNLADPTRLFHVSPKENLEAIMRDGIKAPASLTIGFENYSFVGSITDADEVAIFEVHCWNQPLYPDDDGPGHVQIRTPVPPTDITLVRTVKRPKGNW
jgi:hypothetical protein